MPALQVRDFPQGLYEGLKEAAVQEHRSLAQQTVHAVEEMLARRNAGGSQQTRVNFESAQERQERIAKRKALFARIQEHARSLPGNLPRPEDVVREGRNELDEKADQTIALVEGLRR